MPPLGGWLEVSRRATGAVRAAVAGYEGVGERGRETGRGEGGDMSLAIDRAAEDAIFAELEGAGIDATAISEERGEVAIGAGGPLRVVIDPVDGSLNAKRELPLWGVSIAVAEGPAMSDVEFGYVANVPAGEEWWAVRGEGAWEAGGHLAPRDGDAPLEILAVESAQPELVEAAAGALAATDASRLRMLGSIALALCYVAGGRADAMLSLRTCRSVDAAAGQLIVREAGGAVAFPDAGDGSLGAPLALDMRSRVVAGATPELFEAATRAARKVEP